MDFACFAAWVVIFLNKSDRSFERRREAGPRRVFFFVCWGPDHFWFKVLKVVKSVRFLFTFCSKTSGQTCVLLAMFWWKPPMLSFTQRSGRSLSSTDPGGGGYEDKMTLTSSGGGLMFLEFLRWENSGYSQTRRVFCCSSYFFVFHGFSRFFLWHFFGNRPWKHVVLNAVGAMNHHWQSTHCTVHFTRKPSRLWRAKVHITCQKSFDWWFQDCKLGWYRIDHHIFQVAKPTTNQSWFSLIPQEQMIWVTFGWATCRGVEGDPVMMIDWLIHFVTNVCGMWRTTRCVSGIKLTQLVPSPFIVLLSIDMHWLSQGSLLGWVAWNRHQSLCESGGPVPTGSAKTKVVTKRSKVMRPQSCILWSFFVEVSFPNFKVLFQLDSNELKLWFWMVQFFSQTYPETSRKIGLPGTFKTTILGRSPIFQSLDPKTGLKTAIWMLCMLLHMFCIFLYCDVWTIGCSVFC